MSAFDWFGVGAVAGFMFSVVVARFGVRMKWIHTAGNCPHAEDVR